MVYEQINWILVKNECERKLMEININSTHVAECEEMYNLRKGE